jgi:hypothetical protein
MRRLSAVLSIALLFTGCATAWRDSGSYNRSVQTQLSVQSIPPGAGVFLNNRYLGNAPVTAALDCEQEVKRKTRQVSYWRTQPGWSMLLSVASLGVYVPFSLIPVDTETTQEPAGAFRSNEFSLRLEAGGYKPWSTSVTCGTQPAVMVQGHLEKM